MNLWGGIEGKLFYPNRFPINSRIIVNDVFDCVVESGDKISLLQDNKIGNIRAKNIEQEHALWLLNNPKIQLVGLSGIAGSGKAQPLTEPVLTPSGWVAMGDLNVGDEVINNKGLTSKVIGVFPQGVKDIYRVTFSDGSSTECCKEHLWLTQNVLERSKNRPGKVRSLEEIMSSLNAKRDNRKEYSIPIVAPVAFPEKNLLIDPYLLGCLIGDGCLKNGCITFASLDLSLIRNLQFLLKKIGHYFNKLKNPANIVYAPTRYLNFQTH